MKKRSSITIGIAILASALMLVSGLSSVASSPSSPPSVAVGGQGGHTYFVTVSTGNQSYSYYEEVKGNNIVRTWSAASSPSFKQQESANPAAVPYSSPNYGSLPGSSQGLLSVNSQTSGNSNARPESSYLFSVSGTFNFKPNSALDFSISPSTGYLDMGQALTITQTHTIHDSLVFLWASTDPTFQMDSFQLLTISTTGGPGTTITYALTSPITPGIWYLEVSKSGNEATPGEGAGSIVSNTVEIVVNPAFSVTFASQTPASSIDLGQSITISDTPTITGGTSPYSYQWYLNGTTSVDTISGASGTLTSGTPVTYSFTPGSATTYTFFLEIYDSATSPSSGFSTAITITVNSALVAPTVSPSTTTLDQGQFVTLSFSVPATGTPSYSYQWYQELGSAGYSSIGGATGTSYDFITTTGTTAGTYSFEVKVTDSATAPVTVTTAPVTVVVNAALNAPTLSPSSTALDVGQSVTFTSTSVTTGTPTYSYAWFVSYNSGGYTQITGWSADMTPSLTFYADGTANATGSYSFYLAVTDSAATPVTVEAASVTVIVNTALAATSITPASTALDQGQSVTLTLGIPTTGTPTYTYQWYEEGVGGSYSPVGTGSTTYKFSTTTSTTPGTYSFYATITDFATTPEIVSSAAVTVAVNQGPTVSLSVDQSTIDVGQTATLTASPSNGYGTYTYDWQYEGPSANTFSSISDSSSSSATYVFSSSSAIYDGTGTYTFEVSVKDGNGVTSPYSSTVTVTVNADPTVSISPTSSSFDIGGSQSFSATTDSGTGPYASITSYEWQLGSSSAPSGTSLGSSETFDFTSGTSGTATSTGFYYLWITVTDSNGLTASSSSTVTVNQLPAINAQPSSYSTDSGQLFTALSSTVEYGTGPYTWQWYDSSNNQIGSQGSGTTATLTPSAAGSYHVVFTDGDSNSVTSDAASVTVNADPTVSVTPSSPQTLPTGGSLNLYADVSYSGTNSLSVEWYSNTANSISGATDSGTSGLTFTPSTSSTGTTYYFATVTDGGVPNYSSDSNIVEVTVSASSTPLGVDITSPSVGDASNGSSIKDGVQSGSSFTISFTGFGGTLPYTEYLYYSSTDSSETALNGITGLTQETLSGGSFTSSTTGYYYTLVKDSASPTEWAFVVLYFYTPSSGSGGGGGGGCVLYGTLISISPTQSIPVQDLRVGQQLLSYNTADGQLVEENVTAINVTNVTSIFDINNGLLYVSGATDQPIYVMLPNGTQEWVMVGNLTTYDKVLSPINGSWIPVNSIQVLTGNFTVYDITGSSIFYSGGYLRSDYIANGILLDAKFR